MQNWKSSVCHFYLKVRDKICKKSVNSSSYILVTHHSHYHRNVHESMLLYWKVYWTSFSSKISQLMKYNKQMIMACTAHWKKIAFQTLKRLLNLKYVYIYLQNSSASYIVYCCKARPPFLCLVHTMSKSRGHYLHVAHKDKYYTWPHEAEIVINA